MLPSWEAIEVVDLGTLKLPFGGFIEAEGEGAVSSVVDVEENVEGEVSVEATEGRSEEVVPLAAREVRCHR